MSMQFCKKIFPQSFVDNKYRKLLLILALGIWLDFDLQHEWKYNRNEICQEILRLEIYWWIRIIKSAYKLAKYSLHYGMVERSVNIKSGINKNKIMLGTHLHVPWNFTSQI